MRKPGKCARRFIGNAERNALKPECISPQIDRQCARRRSSGSSRACGRISFRYSAIASVSHTVLPSWVRHGTRIDGDSNSNSARDAASIGTLTVSNTRPLSFASSQPRIDHDE